MIIVTIIPQAAIISSDFAPNKLCAKQKMANCRVIISAVIFAAFCCGHSSAAVIPPEWADIRINPCAKVLTHFPFSFPSSLYVRYLSLRMINN